MKSGILTVILILFSSSAYCQQAFSLYRPDADAQKEISEAVQKAKSENKNVFIGIGGNWCGWCKLFNDLVTGDEEIKEYMNNNFVTVHVNYSKENTNDEVLAQLDYPQRFGFPVFVILDADGKRIHTQNSAYLEEGNGHSKKKVLEFFQNWSPEALNPNNYKRKRTE